MHMSPFLSHQFVPPRIFIPLFTPRDVQPLLALCPEVPGCSVLHHTYRLPPEPGYHLSAFKLFLHDMWTSASVSHTSIVHPLSYTSILHSPMRPFFLPVSRISTLFCSPSFIPTSARVIPPTCPVPSSFHLICRCSCRYCTPLSYTSIVHLIMHPHQASFSLFLGFRVSRLLCSPSCIPTPARVRLPTCPVPGSLTRFTDHASKDVAMQRRRWRCRRVCGGAAGVQYGLKSFVCYKLV